MHNDYSFFRGFKQKDKKNDNTSFADTKKLLVN